MGMRKVVRRGLRELLENLTERVLDAQRVQSPTAVHQLRVASRRLSGNLRTFRSILPKKISRKIRRKLRAIRKATAELRIRDMVLEQMREAGLPSTNLLTETLRQEREEARRLLQDVLSRWQDKDYLGRWRAKLRACRPTKTSVSRLVEDVLRGFFDAGRKASASGSPRQLHEFRLAAKQFRYMLELLQDFHGPELKKQLASIRHVQNRLGEISDCSTSLKLLRDYSGINPSAEAQLERHLERKLDESLTSFKQYSRQELDDPSQEAQWVQFLCGRQC